MGLFDIFRAFKNANKAGGNFGYIAQNIATIYYVLKNSEFGKQLTEDQLLFATALFDTIIYIKESTITIEEIKESVVLSKIGHVRIFPYEKEHEAFCSNTKNRYLIGLAMQVEALIFTAEMLANYRDIVDIIVDKKAKIADTINQTLEQGKNCILYPAVYENVNRWINEQDLRKLILSFEI